MRLYLIPVMFMCFAVDGLLLGAAGALADQQIPLANAALAAALGALYGGACLLPQLRFLGGIGWRIAVLAAMGAVAYGSLGCTALFVVLDLACGALALAVDGRYSALVSALVVCLLCLLGLRGRRGLVPVELFWQGRQERVLALRDTGNGLRDPVTGEQVLVVGPRVASSLLGLTTQQLERPVETLSCQPLPGLRLIPYTAVGGRGFLLALRMPQVRIGGARKSALVAFAATGLDGKFEALTGGVT